MESYISLFILIAASAAVFYFFFIRPESKAKKEKQNFSDILKVGDKVITTFGVYGIIDSMSEETVVLKMLDGRSMMKIDKAAIAKFQ